MTIFSGSSGRATRRSPVAATRSLPADGLAAANGRLGVAARLLALRLDPAASLQVVASAEAATEASVGRASPASGVREAVTGEVRATAPADVVAASVVVRVGADESVDAVATSAGRLAIPVSLAAAAEVLNAARLLDATVVIGHGGLTTAKLGRLAARFSAPEAFSLRLSLDLDSRGSDEKGANQLERCHMLIFCRYSSSCLCLRITSISLNQVHLLILVIRLFNLSYFKLFSICFL